MEVGNNPQPSPTVVIRDSKDADGFNLSVSSAAWRAFITQLKDMSPSAVKLAGRSPHRGSSAALFAAADPRSSERLLIAGDKLWHSGQFALGTEAAPRFDPQSRPVRDPHRTGDPSRRSPTREQPWCAAGGATTRYE